MRILKGIFVIILAGCILSGLGDKTDNRLAAPEETVTITDHSACEARISAVNAENQSLRQELAEARQSYELILQVEIEFVPGLFGDWAVVRFQTTPIPVSAAAVQNIREGENLCAGSSSAVVDCRIIVADIR